MNNIRNILRRPSVITWTQSLEYVDIGHCHNAPDLFVPGCRFWSKGAPTSILQNNSQRVRLISKILKEIK